MDECINKINYEYMLKYYLFINRNKIMLFVVCWLELEDIIRYRKLSIIRFFFLWVN